jgi:hypothetical protein
MTMHLEGPWLTTTKYSKKSHKKWPSSAAKKKAELEAEQWKELQKSWGKLAPNFSNKKNLEKVKNSCQRLEVGPAYPPGREPLNIPSKPDTVGVAAAPAPKVYTGNKIKGIGTLHKSNAVPIFSDEEAIEIAHMRR